MSKKVRKPTPMKKSVPVETKVPPRTFGYEEMLTELEAIVADAEVRLAEEEAAA